MGCCERQRRDGEPAASGGGAGEEPDAGELAGVLGVVGLALRRSRATWLCAHLAAATPLGVLRRIAGPLSANTLDTLTGDVAAALAEEDAAVGGLGA